MHPRPAQLQPSRRPLWKGPLVAAWLAVAAGALVQSGCKGCGKEEPAPAPAPVAAPTEAPAAVPAPEVPSPTGLAAPASPAEAPVYPGPRSESLEGWRITTGFATLKDEPLTEPSAIDENKIFVTVLDPKGRPIGQFDKLERGEMHGFLVARDLRHAWHSVGTGPVREGADARVLTFKPGEGGDHALVTLFKAAGQPAVVVSAPVAVKGALPEVMGPGLASLGNRAKGEVDHLELTTDPAEPVAGKPAHLLAQDLDKTGAVKGEVRLPFVVILNDQMGIGEVVEWPETGKPAWTPRHPGDYLVLAPPTRGKKALAFRLKVVAPPAQP